MNNPNGNIHTASGVANDEKVRVWALSRGALSKSNLHSPQQADRNWKPINAFATHLGRKMGAAHNVCTRVGPKHQNLCMGNWNVTSLNGKSRNWFGRQSSIILIFLEFPLPSVVALILLS